MKKQLKPDQDRTRNEAISKGGPDNRESRYLSFCLCNLYFAIDFDRVKGILDYTPPVKISGTHDHICGVIDFRGTAILVADICSKIGFADGRISSTPCILVVTIFIKKSSMILGIIVDSVLEIFMTDNCESMLIPMEIPIKQKRIHHLAEKKEAIIMLLDTERLFTDNDFIINS